MVTAPLRTIDAILVVSLGWCLLLACSALQPCDPGFNGGQAVITADCQWQEQEIPAQSVVVKARRTVGLFPTLTFERGSRLKANMNGFALTLKRLVLRDLALTPAHGVPGVPKLYPLGLFAGMPYNLTLMDMRLVVSQQDFAQYLELFSKQLKVMPGGPRDVNSSAISMVTDGSSFLSVPYWSDNATELFSVALVTGPCTPASSSVQTYAAPVQPGCNIRAVDNSTLVPILLRDAANATDVPLLVHIMTNVTLGPGLSQAISIRRPVLLLGMASDATSMDLGMVVNQLNVTSRYAQVFWQSLILENLAPGDATSSLVAPPFSTTVTTNVWAMYCNRSATTCLTMANVSLVVPSQEELNYQVFMYTMFNSPAHALREMTEFYRSDLHTNVIQFVPGPANDSLTVIRLLNTGWDFFYVVSTLWGVVAAKRPLPRQAFNMQKFATGALVQALQDCSSFVTALSTRSTSTRTRVWALINNVSLADQGHVQCPWPNGNITYPMQLLGQVVHTHSLAGYARGGGAAKAAARPEDIALGAAGSSRRAGAVIDPYAGFGPVDDGSGPPLAELYSLSFGYVPNLFQLPADAQDKFLQIQNITLAQLPQSAGSDRGLRGLRRLLQRPSPAQGPDSSPVGIWTILLWPFKRAMYGVPLTITDSQLLLPQPEFDALAAEARQAPSFALQLQGQAGGLTFTGVSLLDNSTLRVGAFQGPGIAGTNLWLFPDPASARSIPGYTWPFDLFAQAGSDHSSSGGGDDGSIGSKSVALRAGIGAAVGVLGLTALGLVVLLLRLRKRHVQTYVFAVAKEGAGAAGPQQKLAGRPRRHGSSKQDSVGMQQQELQQQQAQKAENGRSQPDVSNAGDAVGKLRKASARRADAGAAAAAAGVAGAAVSGGRRKHRSAGTRRGTAAADASATAAVDGSSEVSSQHAAVLDGSTSSQSPPQSLEQTIAHGLERWNAAVSSTTLQIMQRRLQTNNSLYSQLPSSSGSSSSAVTTAVKQQKQLLQQQQEQQQPKQQRKPPAASTAADSRPRSSDGEAGLQLFAVIGTGSFGSVYLGSWRGKQVAVKVMHLQNNALVSSDGLPGLPAAHQQPQLQRQQQQNSKPHMAIMEAVVSSTMSHPNVVQVFTYMLSPLVVQRAAEGGQTVQAPGVQQQQQGPGAGAGAGAEGGGSVFGWQLRLVMECCDKGTLRDALDKRRLPRIMGSTCTQPAVVFSLSHDIAAAMLHLHSEGIVHGDLKAGNVLLTVDPSPGRAKLGDRGCTSGLEVWAAAGSPPLSAKVADFGMALPLGPQDTHATMLARGTPTHMSPELFMAGHVSKASDVYAYGILLYEIITGCRAYAGVPIPLLPHEVAMQGLRPEWPKGVPAECGVLRSLAEACWSHKPQDRPSFDHVLKMLEAACRSAEQSDSQADVMAGAQQIIPQFTQQGTATSPPPAQQQQHQAQEQQQQQQQGKAPQPTAGPAGPAQGAGVERKPSRAEPLSWSEISYGGAKHDGGWA